MLSPLVVVVNGVSVCLNTGTCKNIRTPPETMGKGSSSKGWKTSEGVAGSNRSVTDSGLTFSGCPRSIDSTCCLCCRPQDSKKYEDMAKKVDGFVDLTGRGRRTDGTRAPDLLAIGWCSVCSRFAASACQCYRCHG